MTPELSATDRVKLLTKRIQSLKLASGLSVEARLRELKKAELALKIAERDLAAERRAGDKLSRAIKPLPTPQQLWDKGMEREGIRRKT